MRLTILDRREEFPGRAGKGTGGLPSMSATIDSPALTVIVGAMERAGQLEVRLTTSPGCGLSESGQSLNSNIGRNSDASDPCDQFDVTALWFHETGQVNVNPDVEALEENVSDRVAESRALYHLDHVRLIEARKRIFLEVLQMCDRADEALVSYRATQDVLVLSVFHESINALRRMKKEDAPYSAVAKCAVRGYRGSSPSAKLIAEAS